MTRPKDRIRLETSKQNNVIKFIVLTIKFYFFNLTSLYI